MYQVYVERWSNRDGSTDYLWSVWRDGRRIHMARAAAASAEESETEARAFCRQALGFTPDTVIQL